MKETFQILFPVWMGLLAIGAVGSWLMTAWWTMQFMSVKSRVISEIKPHRATIEKELGFFGNPVNQNKGIPPLLRDLAESHELSDRLRPQTRRDLKKTIAAVSLWRRAFFLCWCAGVVTIVVLMIVAAILSAFFPEALS